MEEKGEHADTGRVGDSGDEDITDPVDMSAWDDYGLDESIINALALQGFTAPTAIQHECMPAAIQGNADIIGAAQTVCASLNRI